MPSFIINQEKNKFKGLGQNKSTILPKKNNQNFAHSLISQPERNSNSTFDVCQ